MDPWPALRVLGLAIGVLVSGLAKAETEIRGLVDEENREVLVKPAEHLPVLLHFWATWCPPCVEELPLLAELAQTCRERLRVYGVNVGEDWKTIRTFLRDGGVAMATLRDPQAQVWRRLDGRGLPTNYFGSVETSELAPGPHPRAWWEARLRSFGCRLETAPPETPR